MTRIEIIDHLCAVSSSLLGIVREQATIIANSIAVDSATEEKLRSATETAERELDLIEYDLRPYVTGERWEE